MSKPLVSDVHVDAIMTNISLAYRNMAFIGEQIFPAVRVVKDSDKYFKFTKSSWFTNETAVRAIGGPAKRADWKMDTPGSYSCIEYALAKALPDEIRTNADNPLNPERTTTEWLTNQLLLDREIRIATLALTAGNFTSTSSPSPKWDVYATSDPVKDIETAKAAVQDQAMVDPNVLVMGMSVWRYLQHHPDLLDRIKYTQKAITGPDILAAIFGVDKVLIGRGKKQTAGEDGATYSDIWTDSVGLYFVPSTASLETPAAGYVFESQAREARRWREDVNKSDVFEVSWKYDEAIIAAGAGYVLTDCIT